MLITCTSCNIKIPVTSIIYKCRQCANHFVCQQCEAKEHNRASSAYHTLEPISLPYNSSINPIGSPSKIDENPSPPKTNTSPNSSIFNSDLFLYNSIGFCDRCYEIFDIQDTYFQCEQCPGSFTVCSRCYPFMPTQHPSVHTFSKVIASEWNAHIISGYNHLNVSCDNCSKESFSGRRYVCEQCPPTYDLCEKCYGKTHTDHTFKYVQHPALRASNLKLLAMRTLMLAEQNGNNYNKNWRDPSTGWTKSDAEQIIEEAKQQKKSYDKRVENEMEDLRALTLQAKMNLQDTINMGFRRML